jgi:hypothetical protein
MRRRDFIMFMGGAAVTWPLPVRAQRSAKGFSIGVLYPGLEAVMPERIAAIESGLRSGGLRADQFELLPRVANGDPALLGPLAADLVARKVDVILAMSPAAVREARAATDSIPSWRVISKAIQLDRVLPQATHALAAMSLDCLWIFLTSAKNGWKYSARHFHGFQQLQCFGTRRLVHIS